MVFELNSDKLNIFLSRVNFSKGLQVHRLVWILSVLIKCVVQVLPKRCAYFTLHPSHWQSENKLSCFQALEQMREILPIHSSLEPQVGSCQGSPGTMG